MDTANNQKIFVGYGDDVVELTGKEKTEFVNELRRMDEEKNAFELEAYEKKKKTLEKLEALGLSAEDLTNLGL